MTQTYLESIGFKSTNDRYLIAFLKDLDFLKSDGVPSEAWGAYRHTGDAKKVMASAIRVGWAAMFSLYPDAHWKDDEAIRNWMRTHAPSASPISVDRSLKTFKSIVNLAAFSELDGQEAASSTSLPGEAASVSSPVATIPAVAARPTPEVIINIQLEIPATSDPDTYDRFFSAMRKHLFPGSD